jgi:hypothetical protein
MLLVIAWMIAEYIRLGHMGRLGRIRSGYFLLSQIRVGPRMMTIRSGIRPIGLSMVVGLMMGLGERGESLQSRGSGISLAQEIVLSISYRSINFSTDNLPVGTLVTPKTPSTVLVLLARTSPLTSTSSIGRNSATTTVLEAFVSVASGCRNIRAWVVVSRKKARG